MANSGNVIGQFRDEVQETTGEVAQDVKDSVGQMIEQGVQSVAGKQITPQQTQQKKADEQKRLMWARKVIDYYKNTEGAVKKVREEKQQKEQQRLQAQKQEEQVEEQKKEEKKKQPINPSLAYTGKPEIKRGIGG